LFSAEWRDIAAKDLMIAAKVRAAAISAACAAGM